MAATAPVVVTQRTNWSTHERQAADRQPHHHQRQHQPGRAGAAQVDQRPEGPRYQWGTGGYLVEA